MRAGSERLQAIPSRLPVLIALAAATPTACLGARTALEYRVLLGIVQGFGAWVLTAWISIGALLGCVALAREITAFRRGEPRSSWFQPCRSLLVCAVLTWIGFLVLVESVERIWFELAAGAGAATWLAWIALEGPRPRPPNRLRTAAEVILFGHAAAAVLLEATLRLYAEVHPSPLFARLGEPAQAAIERLRLQPGQLHFGFPCNRGGHYDEEFYQRAPGEQLVVTIGDSFSLGVVPHAYHFSTVCEHDLGIPVDNMGIAAVGPPEYLRLLCDEAVQLDPSVVVIDLFVGNDFRVPAGVPSGPRRWVESWFERENVLLWVVPQRLARLGAERRLRAEEGGRVAIVQGETARGSGAVEETYPWVLDPRLEKSTVSEANYLELETRRASEACRLRPADLAGLHGILLEMERAVGPGKLCVMIIPDEYQVENELWGKVLEGAEAPDLDRYRAQDLLVPWLAARGIACLDLTPVLLAVQPMEDGNRHLYHLRDTHWNARGNAVAGKALASFLASRLTPADSPGTSPDRPLGR